MQQLQWVMESRYEDYLICLLVVLFPKLKTDQMTVAQKVAHTATTKEILLHL